MLNCFKRVGISILPVVLKKNIKDNFIHTSIIISVPIMMFFLSGILEIFTGNINEFNYNIEIVLIPFLGAAIGCYFVGTIVIAAFSRTVSRTLNYFIFVLSFLAYIQNLFFNKFIFINDGSNIDWSRISNYSKKVNLMWILVISLSIILYLNFKLSKKRNLNKLFSLSKYLSLFILIIQLVSIISMIFTGITKHKEVSYRILSGQEQYVYGSQNNIIVLVLDKYTNEEFDELLSTYPEFAENLSDFTYYNNADSTYAYTFPSLTHILTGQDPDITMSRSEWFDTAWNSQRCLDFYKQLHNQGYNCRLFSSEEAYIVFGNLDNLTDKYDNIVNSKPRIDYKMMLGLYTKMSIYKYSPYCLKPYFEISSSDAFKDIVVYDNQDGSVDYYNFEVNQSLYEKGISASESDDKMFTFMHISGLHERNNDKDGNYVEEYSVSIEETKIGLAKIVNKYIEELKEAGIYDNSTIIIMADHGKNPTAGIDPQPIFLIKKQNEKHTNMVINTSPISYDDLQATILTCAEIDYDIEEYGTSIFDWEETDSRERTLSLLEDGFMQYTYTGDRYDLMDMIESKSGVHTKKSQDW